MEGIVEATKPCCGSYRWEMPVSMGNASGRAVEKTLQQHAVQMTSKRTRSTACHWHRLLPLALCLTLALCLSACGTNPEDVIVGRWEEVSWRYEKFDGHAPNATKWIDGIRLPNYPARGIVRHEAEYWEFQPGRVLLIRTRDGDTVRARWRLKGRGHVLKVRYPESDDVEVYDIKELNRNELILNYDIGMEVRGIAQLTFNRYGAKTAAGEVPRAGNDPLQGARLP
jgi:hypothetical protein